PTGPIVRIAVGRGAGGDIPSWPSSSGIRVGRGIAASVSVKTRPGGGGGANGIRASDVTSWTERNALGCLAASDTSPLRKPGAMLLSVDFSWTSWVRFFQR